MRNETEIFFFPVCRVGQFLMETHTHAFETVRYYRVSESVIMTMTVSHLIGNSCYSTYTGQLSSTDWLPLRCLKQLQWYRFST